MFVHDLLLSTVAFKKEAVMKTRNTLALVVLAISPSLGFVACGQASNVSSSSGYT